MIFSYDEMDKVLRLIGHYYNKIIFVDFINDKYRLIKINDLEYMELKKNVKDNFYDWINGFKNSKYSMNLNFDFNPDILDKLEMPISLNYKKVIDGEFKDVTMELLPLGNGTGYILIKNYDMDLPKRCQEDCDKCSNPC